MTGKRRERKVEGERERFNERKREVGRNIEIRERASFTVKRMNLFKRIILPFIN